MLALTFEIKEKIENYFGKLHIIRGEDAAATSRPIGCERARATTRDRRRVSLSPNRHNYSTKKMTSLPSGPNRPSVRPFLPARPPSRGLFSLARSARAHAGEPGAFERVFIESRSRRIHSTPFSERIILRVAIT